MPILRRETLHRRHHPGQADGPQIIFLQHRFPGSLAQGQELFLKMKNDSI